MEITAEVEGRSGVVTLTGRLTVENIASVKDALLEVLNQVDVLGVCVASISAIDMAGIQLLHALHRSARKKNVPLTCTGSLPPHLEARLSLAGVQPEWLAPPDGPLPLPDQVPHIG